MDPSEPLPDQATFQASYSLLKKYPLLILLFQFYLFPFLQNQKYKILAQLM